MIDVQRVGIYRDLGGRMVDKRTADAVEVPLVQGGPTLPEEEDVLLLHVPARRSEWRARGSPL